MIYGLTWWLKSFRKRYRIVHDPQLGYLPEYWDVWDWRVIDTDAGLSVHHDDACKFPEFWHPTDDDAGAVINRHGGNRGQSVVWRG